MSEQTSQFKPEQQEITETDQSPVESDDKSVFEIEEIKIEEMAIDGICGVY